jgi:uncharacterized protein (DUF305 family)
MRRPTAVAVLSTAALTAVALSGVTLAGCGRAADPAGPPAASAAATEAATRGAPEAATEAGPEAAPNDTDVMFAQMSLEHIRQGGEVAALAAERATDPRVRGLAAELRDQWRTESTAMRGWLVRWGRPLAADPDAGAHAGHGDLHSLRPSDVRELRAAEGAAFDRTALSLLLGHLHNGMATARMETAGGRYPPAISLAATMTTSRQKQIETMLTLLA